MNTDKSATLTPPRTPPPPVQNTAPTGLTSDVASDRLKMDGPNAMPDTSDHPLRNALAKFWAPVPWLLEASIILEVVLHKYSEAAIIAGLLVFNAALAYFQESHAQETKPKLRLRWQRPIIYQRGLHPWESIQRSAPKRLRQQKS